MKIRTQHDLDKMVEKIEAENIEMNKFCAWCHINMGMVEPVEDRRITHGCCGDCELELLKQDERGAKENK